MKKTYFTILLALCLLTGFGQVKDSLFQLYQSKQFAALDQRNHDNKHPLYYFYKAVFANVCNQPAASNSYLAKHIQLYKQPSADMEFEYLRLEHDNYVKLFDYTNAESTGHQLLSKYRHKYDDTEFKDEQHAVHIWRALTNEKPQSLLLRDQSLIPLTRDIAGLINIKVKADTSVANFVFDTGAGLSSITESLAQKLKLKILPDTGIQVAGFGRIYNPVKIGIAEELAIGDITIYNEPFLVFNDSAFSFANGAYTINGIIGFPVAKALGQITITSAYLQINSGGTTTDVPEKNFFVDMLNPIILLKYKGQPLPFNFDTGANTSMFSKTFYDAYGSELEKTGKYIVEKSGSAGGEINHTILQVKNLQFVLGDQALLFPSVSIDTANFHVSGKELFGNIGQDLLKQYKTVILNFNLNYIKLED
jgi:hypothetical protein